MAKYTPQVTPYNQLSPRRKLALNIGSSIQQAIQHPVQTAQRVERALEPPGFKSLRKKADANRKMMKSMGM